MNCVFSAAKSGPTAYVGAACCCEAFSHRSAHCSRLLGLGLGSELGLGLGSGLGLGLGLGLLGLGLGLRAPLRLEVLLEGGAARAQRSPPATREGAVVEVRAELGVRVVAALLARASPDLLPLLVRGRVRGKA